MYILILWYCINIVKNLNIYTLTTIYIMGDWLTSQTMPDKINPVYRAICIPEEINPVEAISYARQNRIPTQQDPAIQVPEPGRVISFYSQYRTPTS